MFRKHPVTTGIIAANLLVFGLLAWQQETLMFDEYEDYLALFWSGANFNPLTLDTQSWRLLTSMFLHGNVIHLLVNMYALFSIGRPLEEELRPFRFFVVYLITGLAGGIASLVFGLFAVSVGASGAIFGLYGFYILGEVFMSYRNKEALLNLVINFVIFVAVNYMVATHINVDTAAHIGGFLAGAALAVVRMLFKGLSPVALFVILLSFIPIVLLLPRDQVQYYKLFQSVIREEDHQQQLYRQNLSDHQLADSLKLSLGQWDSIRHTLRSLPRIPRGLEHDTTVLSAYLSLRRDEVAFQVKEVERESYVYLDSLEITHQKLDSLPPLQHILNFTLTDAQASEAPTDSPKSERLEQVRVLYDSNWAETASYDAPYFRIGTRDSLGRWQGNVRDYYSTGNVQMKGNYRDGMQHGVFRYYSNTRKYESAGRYDKEMPVGKWEYFHNNGTLHREVYYTDRVFTKSVYDTAGNAQVVNGEGRQVDWYPNGTVKEEGIYKNGTRQGIWKGYYSDGRLHYEEYYENNLLVKGRALDRKGHGYIYDESGLYPRPAIGFTLYKKYLKDNIRKTGKSGKVKLTFSVDEDGALRDFVILESLDLDCDREAIRLVQNGPAWLPVLLHGHIPTRAQGFVEVEFDR